MSAAVNTVGDLQPVTGPVVEAAIQLKERGSTARVILLTVHEDRDFIRAALRIGVTG